MLYHVTLNDRIKSFDFNPKPNNDDNITLMLYVNDTSKYYDITTYDLNYYFNNIGYFKSDEHSMLFFLKFETS